MHVLLIPTDLTKSTVKAAIKISLGRRGIPGKKGRLPGYLYTDLSALCDREKLKEEKVHYRFLLTIP